MADSADLQTRLRLDGLLSFRLSVLSNAVSGRMAEIYEREFDLTIWQWRVMAALGESGSLTSTEIAQRIVMEKPAVSRAVASLVERDLVARGEVPGDRRKAPLSLTPAGQRIYDAVMPRVEAVQNEMLVVLTEDEQYQLGEMLTRLSETASPDRALWTPSPS